MKMIWINNLRQYWDFIWKPVVFPQFTTLNNFSSCIFNAGFCIVMRFSVYLFNAFSFIRICIHHSFSTFSIMNKQQHNSFFEMKNLYDAKYIHADEVWEWKNRTTGGNRNWNLNAVTIFQDNCSCTKLSKIFDFNISIGIAYLWLKYLSPDWKNRKTNISWEWKMNSLNFIKIGGDYKIKTIFPCCQSTIRRISPNVNQIRHFVYLQI